MLRTHPSRRGAVLRLSAVALLALTAACGGGGKSSDKGNTSKEKVTLTVYWWGGPDRAKRTQQALDAYHAKHPEISFTYQWQGYSGYYDKLSTNAAGGQVPDIYQIDEKLLTQYATKKLTLNLNPYVGKELSVTDLASGAKQSGTVGTAFAAVPAAINTYGLIYDKTLLQQNNLPLPQIGWSWDQYATWAAQVSTATGGKVFGSMDPSADYKVFQDWLRQRGKDFYKNGKLGFTAADLTQYWQYWVDLRKANGTPAAAVVHPANGGDVTKQLVVTKQAATSFQWDNQLTEMSKSTDHTLGVTAFPGSPKGQYPRAAMYWSAYSHTKHPKQAVAVINYLINDLSAAKALGSERGLPVNLKVRKQVQSTFDAITQQVVSFEQQMASKFGKVPAPPPDGAAEASVTLFIQYAEAVEYGRSSPADAAAQYLTQAKAALVR